MLSDNMAISTRRKEEDLGMKGTQIMGASERRAGIIKFLLTAFLVIWIAIGLFVVVFIVQSMRLGVFDYVIFGKGAQAGTPQTAGEVPTETTLPKIGKINISCAETALKPESIQKLVSEYDYDINKLSSEEKKAFEKCIVETPQASPKS